jgi:hypothetical protein
LALEEASGLAVRRTDTEWNGMNVAGVAVSETLVAIEVVIGLKVDGLTVVVVVDASVVSWMRLFGVVVVVVFVMLHLFNCGCDDDVELVVLLLEVDDHFLKTAAKESGTTTGDWVGLRTLVTTVHLPMVMDGRVVIGSLTAS